MEHRKISKLINNSTLSKFLTRKWIEVNDLFGNQYSFNKNMRFKTPMLRLNLCDYSDTYIVVTVEGTNANNRTDKMLAFKNNTPFRLVYEKSITHS